MKSTFLTAISAFVLAFNAFSPAWGQDVPQNHNPNPADCSRCITINVQGVPTGEKVGQSVDGFPSDENGNYSVNVEVKIGSGDGCTEVSVTSVKFVSEKTGYEHPAGESGNYEIPGDIVKEHGHKWKVVVECDGESDADEETGNEEGGTSGCEAPFTLDEGCAACESGSCPGEGSNGSFTYNIPVGKANGGDTHGTLRFFTKNFENPGVSALYAMVPSSYVVNRNAGGNITSITTQETNLGTGGHSILVESTPTAFDPNAFTVTHKDPGGVPFRVAVIGLVEVGGVTRLRADSTFSGSTFRYEQTQPEEGTLVLESGQIEGGNFIGTRRETHIVQRTEPRVEIQRDIIEERADTAGNYQAISDIKATWTEFMWNWEKTLEVIDPDGAALTSTWTYYEPGEHTGPDASIAGLGRLKSFVRYDGHEEFHTYWLHHQQTQQPFASDSQGLTILREYHPQSRTTTITRSVGENILSKTSESFDRVNSRRINTVYTAEGASLVTTTEHVPYGQDFGGQPTRITSPDGTLITYAYSRDAAARTKSVVMEIGAGEANVVTQGMRTTTDYNRFGTVIRRLTQGIGHGTGGAVFDHLAVTSVDSIGRALVTAHFPSASSVVGDAAAATDPKWTTTLEYACCGVVSETDSTGIVTRYAYDGLRRKVKTNRLGVTSETVYNGLVTDTHRYPEVVGGSLSSTLVGSPGDLIGREVRNLTGTLRESWTPNSASTTAGDLVKTSAVTTYQPAAGISERTVTTAPDSFTMTENSFLDGKSATSYGDLRAGMSQNYSVNATGLVTSTSYLDGAALRETTTITSDWSGRQIRTDFGGGAFSTVSYNAFGQKSASKDPDGVTTLFSYNSRGELAITALDLNSNAQIDFGTDQITLQENVPALSGVIPVWRSYKRIWQNGDTNPAAGTLVATSEITPDGLFASATTLGVANPSTNLTVLAGGGSWTKRSVSPDGSYSITSQVAGRMDSTAFYDSDDNLITSGAARDAGNSPGSGYDELGRPTHTSDSRTGVTSATYLSATADLAASISDPANRTTAFTYDVRGRKITIDAPDTLDAEGNALGNITVTNYFPDGNIKEISGGPTYRVSNTYDYARRQKTLTTYGAQQATTTWTYDSSRGFMVRKEYDDGKGTSYTHTAAGRLQTRTWERGVVTTYVYDNAGRLTGTTYSDATPDVAITYDALGRKTLETQTNRSQIAYAYDPATLVQDSETISYDLNADGVIDFSRTLDRSRDALNRDAGWQLKDGAIVENELQNRYDLAGRLGETESDAGIFTYGYLPQSAGILQTVTGPVHTVTNSWDTTRAVLLAKENEISAGALSSYGYGVNAMGQRTDLAQSGSAFTANRSTVLGYDSFGQVVTADSTIPGLDRAYQYDTIGNRLKSADSLTLPGADNYTSNVLNQYTAVGSASPSYDTDGNATAYPLPANPLANSTLVWDAENRLVSTTVSGVTTSYLYDAAARRISSETNGSTITYIYNGWNPVAEYAGSTLAKIYTWGMDVSGSMQGAGGVGGLLAVKDGSATYYPTYDGNGNVSEYLDSTGAVQAHYEYDPFGRTTVATGNKAQDFSHRFSTKPLDAETGLYYYGHRYYDPMTGRWPSRDPIEEAGGINIYTFVHNNGIRYIDIIGAITFKDGASFPVIPGVYVAYDWDVTADITDCEICISGSVSGKIGGGISWSKKGGGSKFGVGFSYELEATLSAIEIERKSEISITYNHCTGALSANGRMDLVNLKVGIMGNLTAIGELESPGNWVEFELGISGGFDFSGELGLAIGISATSSSLSIDFLGTATANALLYADLTGEIEIGSFEPPPFVILDDWKKDLTEGSGTGFRDKKITTWNF